MSSSLILHSQSSINCAKIISQFVKGKRYLTSCNSYLIPFHCRTINHSKRFIVGDFIYPMWNILERSMIKNGGDFTYSYIQGKDFTIEYFPKNLIKYYVIGETKGYIQKISISELTLYSNSILLFPIHKDIASPLINYKLL